MTKCERLARALLRQWPEVRQAAVSEQQIVKRIGGGLRRVGSLRCGAHLDTVCALGKTVEEAMRLVGEKWKAQHATGDAK
jgi:hypothetical protein